MLRAVALAGTVLALWAGPARAAVPEGPPYFLHARGADARNLIVMLARSQGRIMVVGPDVEGTKVTLDLESDSLQEIEDAVVRISGARSLVIGTTVLVGGDSWLAAAKRHPTRASLDGREYPGRKVSVAFVGIRFTNLLRIFADLVKRPFEVAEGVEGSVAISAIEVPWTQVLDVLTLANDLKLQNADGTIRVSRRGDPEPRFSPLGRDHVQNRPTSSGGTNGQLKLVAISNGPRGLEAVIRSPDGFERFVRPGPVASRDIQVSSIDRDRVVVLESRQLEDGERETQTRVLLLDGK